MQVIYVFLNFDIHSDVIYCLETPAQFLWDFKYCCRRPSPSDEDLLPSTNDKVLLNEHVNNIHIIDHVTETLTNNTVIFADGDFVLTASTYINSRHVQNSIVVQVERHLNFPNATKKSRQCKLAQQILISQNNHITNKTKHIAWTYVVFGDGAFTFKHTNQQARPVVAIHGKDFRGCGGNGGVALDHGIENSICCIDTQRKWGHVRQRQILQCFMLFTGEDGCLDG